MMPPKRAAPGRSQDGWHESDKYIDVYFYENTRRWVAWVREPRVGGGHVFIGSHLTEKLAARCQDRALLKLEMDSSMTQPIKLNFDREDYQEDEHLRNTLTSEKFVDLLLRESRQSHKKRIDDELATPADSDLALLADLTVWHQMPYLPAHRLIQLNCKRWPVWSPNNIKRIVEARRADDTRDWYFPVIVKKDPPEISGDRTWWWSGIWHSAADHAESKRVHTLPPLTHLPRECILFGGFGDILAASSGLFLIKTVPGPSPEPRRQTRSPRHNGPRFNYRVPAPTVNLLVRPFVRLLVCNPLTKECRALPSVTDSAVNGAGVHLRHHLEWHMLACLPGVLAHMVMDDAANNYKVILTLKTVVCVYKSSCNSWACWRFPTPRPWGYRSGSAHVRGRGRLYFADVDAAPRVMITLAGTAPILHAAPAGDLRLFEVEAGDDAGRWSLLHTYPLRKYHLPFLTRGPDWDYDISVSPFVELVECMEGLYAVIPARLDEVLTTGPTQSRRWRIQVLAWKYHDGIGEAELECMPLVFYIMQLQPELQGAGAGVGGLDHGVLRIQIPKTRSDIESRRTGLYKKADPGFTFWHESWSRNWFRCTARNSVIWVAFDDYLLQYDVASWESKTQIIPLNETDDETLRFSYTPSFHMKP